MKLNNAELLIVYAALEGFQDELKQSTELLKTNNTNTDEADRQFSLCDSLKRKIADELI